MLFRSCQSIDAASHKHSTKGSVQKSPEKSSLTDPPPIPPKISSNQNPGDLSPPALPTTPPPIKLNEFPNIEPTNLILNSSIEDRNNEDDQSLIGTPTCSKVMKINDKDKLFRNDCVNQEHEDTTNKEPISVSEQVIDTQTVVKAEIGRAHV